jgi:hypothetical protein
MKSVLFGVYLITFIWDLSLPRAMSEAQYTSTGEINGERALSHYGLGLEKYTHFTSPIRRYADVGKSIIPKYLLVAGPLVCTEMVDFS